MREPDYKLFWRSVRYALLIQCFAIGAALLIGWLLGWVSIL